MTLGLEVSHVAPLYNLGLVIIVLWLFTILVSIKVRDKRVYMTPWKLLFFAVIVFVIEEVLTVLRMQEIIDIPRHINGFFELIIISTFIYALLLQKERMKRL
jgi:hypothetical protein